MKKKLLLLVLALLLVVFSAMALSSCNDEKPDGDNESTGNEGTGNEGTGNEGTGNEGTGNEGTGNEGTGNEGGGGEEPPAHTHTYGEPSWTWTDYSAATAKFTCANNAEHTETVNATITNAVTKEAKCAETGTRTYTATVRFDGKTYTDTKTQTIEALQHNWDAGTVTTEAKCSTKGVKTFTCGRCSTTKTEDISATGIHTYNTNDICTGCNQAVVYTTGLEFNPINNGTAYEVYGIGNVTETQICIPKTYGGKNVTKVADFAFQNCTTVKSIYVPSTVTEIGGKAFAGCTALVNVDVGSNVTSIGQYAFMNCTSLKNVDLGDKVTTFGESVFSGCTQLNDITIPGTMVTVTKTLFSGSSIKNITLLEGITSVNLNGYTALESISLPSTVKTIADSAFYGCYNLTSISMPNSIDSIGASAFRGCSKLVGITIPSSVKTIGSYAFYSCSSLATVTMGSGVESIGASAFYGCTKLQNITIPTAVTVISASTFYNCSSLATLTLPSGVTSIGASAFNGCRALTAMTIPASVNSVGENAFSGCTKLIKTERGISTVDKWVVDCDTASTSVTIADGVVGISDSAFSGCSNLQTVKVPSNIKYVGNSAFSGCTSLTYNENRGVKYLGNDTTPYVIVMSADSFVTEITIPATVKYIYSSAFSGASLTKITYEGTKTQWEAVAKGNGWLNKSIDCTLHCTDGQRVLTYVMFGSYPQTEVTDTTLKTTLNGLAGTLPSTSNSQSWTTINTSTMWYKDVTHGGEKYRGIYFISSRNFYQSSNGYNTSTVYWFKFEPIKWRILTEEGGKAFLLCDMLIDSQAFDSSSNNYEQSDIRAWLNDNFYNTAFSELEKALIQTTEVDNSVASTGYSSNSYACANTNDKVFLLSRKEVINSAYGLGSYAAREKQTTDYAQCQGAYTSTNLSYAGNGYWWLRSPYYSSSGSSAQYVSSDGYVDYCNHVRDYDYGVCPALWITL